MTATSRGVQEEAQGGHHWGPNLASGPDLLGPDDGDDFLPGWARQGRLHCQLPHYEGNGEEEYVQVFKKPKPYWLKRGLNLFICTREKKPSSRSLRSHTAPLEETLPDPERPAARQNAACPVCSRVINKKGLPSHVRYAQRRYKWSIWKYMTASFISILNRHV